MQNYKIKLRRYNGVDYDTLQITAEDVIDGQGNSVEDQLTNINDDIIELQNDYESGTNNGWTYVRIGNIITATKTVNLTNVNISNTTVTINHYYSDWISLGALPTNINQGLSQIYGTVGRVKNSPSDIYGGYIALGGVRVQCVSILNDNVQVRVESDKQLSAAEVPVLCQIIGRALT